MSVPENVRGTKTLRIFGVPRWWGRRRLDGPTQFEESFRMSLLPGSNSQPFESYGRLKLGPPKDLDATRASLHTNPKKQRYTADVLLVTLLMI